MRYIPTIDPEDAALTKSAPIGGDSIADARMKFGRQVQRSLTPGRVRPGVDGVQFPAVAGLAAAALYFVLIYHSNYTMRGFLGIEVLFVVVGFVVTLNVVSVLAKGGGRGLGTYYVHGIKRYLPLLLLTLAVVGLLLVLIGTPYEKRITGPSLLATLLQSGNWEQLNSGILNWDGNQKMRPLAHSWTLALAGQFAFIWPGVLWALWRLIKGKPWILCTSVTVLFVGSALVSMLPAPGIGRESFYMGFGAHGVSFIGGAVAATAVWLVRQLPRNQGQEGVTARRSWKWGLSALSTVSVLGLLWADSYSSHYQQSWLYNGGFTVVAVLAAILVATLCFDTNLLTKAFSLGLLEAFGRLGVEIFILHLPVYWILHTIAPGITPSQLFFYGALTTLTVAAVLQHRLFIPWTQQRWTLTHQHLPITAAALITAATAWGATWSGAH